MKELLKRYRYVMFIVSIPYILFVLMLVIPTKKSVTLPGDVVNINTVVSVENANECKGSFNSTFVTSNENLTLFQLSLCQNRYDAYLYDYDEDYDLLDDITLNRVNKMASLNNAIIASFKKASEEVEYTFKGIVVTSKEDFSSFEVGDIILGSSREEIINSLDKSKAQNTLVQIERYRSGKYVQMSINPKVENDSYGISLINKSYYDIYDIKTQKSIFTYSSSVGGPSGGLLQALSIYNSLTEFDYSRGLKISGTGTIDIYGNVGVIGGIKQKVYTAAKSKCDIFFTPDGSEESYEHQNYLDASSVLKDANEKYNTNMKLVPVKNLDEALEYLKNYEN